MRQVAVLPSGVQNQKNGQILHFNNEYIFYASTLAVYVLNAQTFVLERILSLNPKAIVSITFSPSDSNLMVVSSLDGSICLWSVQNEEMLSRIQLKPAGVVVWDPFEPNICGLCVTGTGPLKLYDWDVSRAGGVLVEILSMQNEALQSSVVRWNPNLRGQIAIGGANGAVFLYNKHTKDRKYMHKPDRKNPVRDLQWDRLSSSYLLVAYSFYISLWDASSGTEIHCFEQQTAEITGVAWLDWTAGNFVTTNARNANLKVWNASQKAPLDTMKFPGSAGLHAIVFCAGTKRALCAAEDGSVSVVNAADCRVEFVSSAGHKETIFDCKLSPTSPNVFCTASYDSTVKV
ncbi:WD40-repeat-containing domain protein [Ochromonadaceae sp. CCMP2298]|nr:WD40-repeat-containing domain protein [Ochromonadaceae sp. CCMP2298]